MPDTGRCLSACHCCYYLLEFELEAMKEEMAVYSAYKHMVSKGQMLRNQFLFELPVGTSNPRNPGGRLS